MGHVVGDSVGAHGDLDRDRPDDQEDQRLAADALDEFFGDQCCEWSHGSADPLPKPQAGQHHYGRPVGQEKGGIAPELLLSAPFERDPAGDLYDVPGGEQRRLPVEDFGPAGDGEREAGEQNPHGAVSGPSATGPISPFDRSVHLLYWYVRPIAVNAFLAMVSNEQNISRVGWENRWQGL